MPDLSQFDGGVIQRVTRVVRAAPDPSTAPTKQVPGSRTGLLAAWHLNAPSMMIWAARPGSSGITVLCASGTASPAGIGTIEPVALAPGARGTVVSPDDVHELLEDFDAWTTCDGGPRLLGSGSQDDGSRQTFEDIVTVIGEPFAWLVSARPLSISESGSHLRSLSREVAALAEGARGDVIDSTVADLTKQTMLLMSPNSQAALWSVTVQVGGVDIRGATRAAALLTSAATTADVVGFGLRPSTARAADDTEADAPTRRSRAAASVAWSHPFVCPVEFLETILRVPNRELPNLRAEVAPDFDLVPEPDPSDDGVVLGAVIDGLDRPIGAARIRRSTIARHGFVAGATGAGKSITVRRILQELSTSSAPVPWLVLESAKAEYAAMGGRLGHPVAVLRPGDPNLPPAGLNPLEPSSLVIGGEPRIFPLQTHLDLVRSLFLAAFDATDPFPQILATSLTRCYEDLGWDLVTSRRKAMSEGPLPLFPDLSDLQATALQTIDGIGYGKEVKDNVSGFVNVRLGSLRNGTPGRFFQSCHPLDLEALLAREAVIELEDIGDDAEKGFLIGVVIIRIVEHLRLLGPSPTLRHVLVVEEAHRLLRRVPEGSPSARAVEMFAALLAEVRAYGEGIVVAEQIPSKIAVEVVKNSALKVLHRLPAADDREFVGSTMNLDQDQSKAVVSFLPGIAAVHVDGADHPLRVAVNGAGEKDDDPLISSGTAPMQPRSVACPSECADSPCSLSSVESAILPARRQATVWIELVVAAAMAMRPPPKLGEDLRIRFGPSSSRQIQCALATAVDAVIKRVVPKIPPEVDIRLLTAAVAALVHADIGGGGIETHSVWRPPVTVEVPPQPAESAVQQASAYNRVLDGVTPELVEVQRLLFPRLEVRVH